MITHARDAGAGARCPVAAIAIRSQLSPAGIRRAATDTGFHQPNSYYSYFTYFGDSPFDHGSYVCAKTSRSASGGCEYNQKVMNSGGLGSARSTSPST